MSAHDKDEAVAARRRPLARREIAALSPLPPPEEVFIDWLMSVPHDADLEVAAQRKIEVIDRRGTLHPDVLRLRTLLAVVAGTSAWPKQVHNL